MATSVSSRLKVMTVVGTRPEVIRLSRVIAVLAEVTDHRLVHTGQNHDYELNGIFFDELGVPAGRLSLPGVSRASVHDARRQATADAF